MNATQYLLLQRNVDLMLLPHNDIGNIAHQYYSKGRMPATLLPRSGVIKTTLYVRIPL